MSSYSFIVEDLRYPLCLYHYLYIILIKLIFFQAMKLDLDFKEEKIGALNKELEELQVGGGASEEEVSALKRQKHDLDMRLKDQVMAFILRYGICSFGIG